MSHMTRLIAGNANTLRHGAWNQHWINAQAA